MLNIIYFCFVFLICGINCNINNKLLIQDGDSFNSKEFRDMEDHRKNESIENYGYYENLEYHKYNDLEYIGNPDFDAIIERPCRVFDLNCIRRYFVKHAKCKLRRGPLPDRLLISQESLYFSRVNLTVTVTNYMVNGFRNTRIEEFYINRRTNKMVFAIQVRAFTESSPSTYLEFFRAYREPIVLVTEALQSYPSVTFTAVIPNIDDLQLKESEITAFSDSVPFFLLAPELLNNTDPTVAQSIAELIADTPTSTQESFFTDSQLYLPAYIQFNICDFGLSIK